jgi:monoterpene epsilon-lactone hydrolase
VSISEQAQQALNAAPPLDHMQQPEPDTDDPDGWLRWVETREAPGREMLAPLMPPEHRLACAKVEFDGVHTYVLRPNHVAEDSAPPIFNEIHGGSLIMGGGDLAWTMTAGKATDRNGSTWVPDYRMRPCTATPPRSMTASSSTATH